MKKDLQVALREAGAVFSQSSQGEAVVSIGGVRAIVHADEVLFILHEIFVGGSYNVYFDYPAVVWDIGMNRGLASLYFAKRPNVVAVIAYEPFKQTYHQAQQNFSLNPKLSSKIIPFNYGIGSENKKIRTGYCEQWTGNMSIDGVPRWLAEDPSVVMQEEEVEIKNAGEILDRIGVVCPGLPIIAKIDCEGSEYEIIQLLHQSGRLSRIKAILMEWHLRGSQDLLGALRDVGFTAFLHNTLEDRGMIYAVR